MYSIQDQNEIIGRVRFDRAAAVGVIIAIILSTPGVRLEPAVILRRTMCVTGVMR